jgi:hypothetical protein
MALYFKSGESALAATGLWPKAKLLSVMRRRYSAVDELGEEHGFDLYGVTDGEVRFGVILVEAEGAPDKVSEIGFLARFPGYSLDQRALAGVNRNLHLSVASVHSDGDLYLIGGVAAAGDFSEATFTLILEAWKRDLVVLIHALTSRKSFAESVLSERLAPLARFASNRLAEDGGEFLASFAGGGRRKMLCGVCGGRGKVGFIARPCESCDASGFVATPQRG